MKVYVYQGDSEVSAFFERPEFAVPFLSSNLLDFFVTALNRAGFDAEVHLPATWGVDGYREYTQIDLQGDEYGFVLIAPLTGLPIFDFSDSDFTQMKQQPGRLFASNGVIGGYVRFDEELPEPREDESFFQNIHPVNLTNFLRYNQRLVGQLETYASEKRFEYFGEPIVLTDNVSPSSTICGPCYIGKDVSVVDSYIGPGTVITGNAVISNSTVLQSFVNESKLYNNNISNALITDSVIEGLTSKRVVAPYGSVIQNL